MEESKPEVKELKTDDEKLAEKAKKEAEAIRGQLQPSIDALKQKNEELLAKFAALEKANKEMLEEKEKLAKAKEDAEKAKEEEKKTLGQKLQEFTKATEENIKRVEDERKRMEVDFQKKLEQSRLTTFREKELAKNNDILPEFHVIIPDPEQTNTSQEDILKAIALAKEKSNSLKSRFISNVNQIPAAPIGDQHISAIQPVDLSNLQNTGMDDLEKLKADLFKRFNLS